MAHGALDLGFGSTPTRGNDAADLPVNEIVPIADTVIVRPDPVAETA
jgi:hypothetical protein